MYAVQRHAWIVDRARAAGRVEVSSVSAELERQGLLRPVHGGAVPIERLGFEGHLRRHARSNRAAKARIARAATGLPRNAESVYLDEGSTVQRA